MKDWNNVVAYSTAAEDAINYVKQIEAQLKERYEALVAGNDEILNTSELLVLVVDNQDALLAICGDKEGLNAYKNIIGKYKNMNVCFITFVENAPISYNSPEILKNMRDQRHFIVFEDMANLKLFDAPLAMTRAFKKPIDLGDGYYIKDNECVKLKTPICGKR